MRVLFLTDAVFEDLPGGSRVVARELAEVLARRGHEVTFLVPRQGPGAPDDERHGSIRVVRYAGAGQGWGFVRAGQAACARLWAEGPFDVAHTHFAYAAVGPLRAVPRGVPRVRSFYGPWDREGWVEDNGAALHGPRRIPALVKRFLRRRIEAANLRGSRAVIVLSEQSRAEVREFGYPTDRVRLAPGGVDLNRFTPAADNLAIRRVLALPEDRCILLSVRRLMARMGLDRLVEAMPTVVASRPDVLLLIGGQGPERERLERRIFESGMQDNVRLVGFIPDDALAAYYQAADLFVLPTVALEGFGLVTVEALACGTPVIGTPVGATPEILRGLDTRLIAQDATPAGLARSILGFLDGDWTSALTRGRLRGFVEDHYTWERHAEAVEAVYGDALGAATRGSALAGSVSAL